MSTPQRSSKLWPCGQVRAVQPSVDETVALGGGKVGSSSHGGHRGRHTGSFVVLPIKFDKSSFFFFLFIRGEKHCLGIMILLSVVLFDFGACSPAIFFSVRTTHSKK